MWLTATIVRARGCHCPFKQIDRRPTGRSIEQSTQGKGRKMASQARSTRRASRCGAWKTLASEIPPLSYYRTFPADRKSLPAIDESRARTNKQSRTKREDSIVSPATFTKYRPLCNRKGRILSLWCSESIFQ